MWCKVMEAANIMDTSVHVLCELAQMRCIQMTELVLHELIIKWLYEKGVALLCVMKSTMYCVFHRPEI